MDFHEMSSLAHYICSLGALWRRTDRQTDRQTDGALNFLERYISTKTSSRFDNFNEEKESTENERLQDP